MVDSCKVDASHRVRYTNRFREGSSETEQNAEFTMSQLSGYRMREALLESKSGATM